jgi:hypothetical protein
MVHRFPNRLTQFVELQSILYCRISMSWIQLGLPALPVVRKRCRNAADGFSQTSPATERGNGASKDGGRPPGSSCANVGHDNRPAPIRQSGSIATVMKLPAC